MAKRFKAAVIGGSGYGGAELIRRLLAHPEVELARVASVDFVGEPLSHAHPNLEGQTNLRFEGLTPAEAAKDMDIVLLGLPHKVSALKMPELMATGAKVVDLSGDFRLRDTETYKKYYGADHPYPNLLTGTFVYGLPELNREAIRTARYVASPGCFATTIELALLPLARAGLLEGSLRDRAEARPTSGVGGGRPGRRGGGDPRTRLLLYDPLVGAQPGLAGGLRRVRALAVVRAREGPAGGRPAPAGRPGDWALVAGLGRPPGGGGAGGAAAEEQIGRAHV